MKRTRLFTLSAALLCTALTSYAADSEDLDKDIYDFEDVVVTATGTQRRMVDSPAPISVITAKEIETSGVTRLDDALLKLSPSFSTHTSGMGTTMTLNGLDDDYFIFLMNGRRVERDYPFHQINMSRVKRIEILSGASAVLYGANAIGGVVNIITDEGTDMIDISSNTQVGSKGRLAESINADLNFGKFSSSSSYNLQRADNWQLNGFEEDDDELIPTISVASVGFERESASQKFGYKFNDKLSISANGGFYIYRTNRPTEEGEGDYTYDLYHEDYTYGADVTYKFSDKSQIIATYYGEKYYYYRDYTRFDEEDGWEFQDRTIYNNANIRGIFAIGDSNTISAGGEYIVDALLDDDYDDKTMTYALFAQDEFKLLKNLSGVVGVRYTHQSKFGSNVSPNASLMYKIGKFNLRASYASGFRAPTLAELYAEEKYSKTSNRLSYSNEDLNPERSNYTSLNAEYNSKALSVSVTGFYNSISDMIAYNTLDETIDYTYTSGSTEYTKTDVGQQQYQNVAQSEIWGINISANARLGAGFTIGANYTGLDPKNITDDEQIDKSVKNAITTHASWDHKWDFYKLNININGRYSDERYYSYDGSYAPDYWMFDLNTTHSFEMKKFFIEPAIGVENIFDYVDDRPYNSNYATLSPGRSIFASLTIRFKH